MVKGLRVDSFEAAIAEVSGLLRTRENFPISSNPKSGRAEFSFPNEIF